ncbi:hypothetical protein [Serratia marcescens]|uniref:hypothetical protein n=1 Tax=Serratia marcescens TaxID=615 RepID=UPI0004E3CAEB|nr:hypothetical protein [Serratia marcescens]KFD11062.1 hypothetical protein GSMA_04385 [Serratia marcescens subsp. marcescens ATCC 13880]KFL02604.1 hypothetical protein DP21_4078 [Serratia marcescens]MCC3251315.1 hypothetical protein [Serratia marcescens]PNU43101.1 hypothetical protein C2M02_20510 [Serratia marcescens subsp. marcescens ATCC 13880]QSO58980.1 hypothetical protein J0F99_06740 [Serratia marcescens subsp. marcescens ATCC 13880]
MYYINQVFYKVMDRRELRRMPRDRFTIYQKDLHRIAQDVLTESTLLEGDQYSYTELGDAVLQDVEKGQALDGVDMAMFCYWTPEFDPDYSAFGPYFMDRYKINGHSFDICDNGSLASATALNVAGSYLKNGSVQKILLLGMEQNTIPRNIEQGFPVPSRSCSVAALLTAEKRPESQWKLINSGHITEWDSGRLEDSYGLLIDILTRSNTNTDDVVLLTQRSGYFYKKLRFHLETTSQELPIDYAFLRPDVTGMNALLTLAGETLAPLNKRTVLLIEHDMESLRMAWSVLQKVQEVDHV